MIGFFSKEQTSSTAISKSKSSCFSCGLIRDSIPLEPYGNFKKRIMIIGEFPGAREILRNKPWQGKEGRLLQKTMKDLGVDLFEDCISLYSIFCDTHKKKPTPNQIDCCSEVKVFKVIAKYKPQVVLLLGLLPLTSIIGSFWKKKLGGLAKWRGWTIPNEEYNTWFCPTFAPEYVQYMDSPEVDITWKRDLKRALQLEKRPKYNKPNIQYIEDLTILDSITSKMVAFDYEATGIKPYFKGHRIVCMSIAFTRDDVYVFMLPSKKSLRQPVIRFLENRKIKKIASNMKYEDQWSDIRLQGAEVKEWFHDTMLTAHELDNRSGITSLKFQAFVKMGIVGYSEEVDKYITKSRQKDNKSNAINMIDELVVQPNGAKELMKYCALDSIYEYRLAEIQIEEMNHLV